MKRCDMDEIRIKKEPEISDKLAMRLVLSVVAKGKISGNGEHYCYVTEFEVNGEIYDVLFDQRCKTKVFKIWKRKNLQ